MFYIACGLAMAILVCWPVSAFQEASDPLHGFLMRIRGELAELPNYVCTQTVERFNRNSPEQEWRKSDSLRFDVALAGDQELYGPPGGRYFHARPLAEVVGHGTVSTGRLGLLAKHVFADSAASFSYRGPGERDGRRAYEYDFEVLPDRSNYRLRSGNAEELVGFQGTFWFDAHSFDLIRLELQAFDMPESLGIAEANTKLNYSRLEVDGRSVLAPVSGTVLIATTDSLESLNRMTISACRYYRVESSLRFGNSVRQEGERAVPREVEAVAQPRSGSLLEIALEAPLDLESAHVGDEIKARVLKTIREDERVIVSEGSVLTGNITRLEKETIPFPMYQVGLAFTSLSVQSEMWALSATMEDAGPHPGLIRQTKRINPTFTRRRAARMDILVREVHPGQGFMHWDARRGPIPRGFRMKWRVANGRK